ncbi:hypothetical protein [Bilophila sp.]|uniref:hypothetical protein n=1 Tax=Bilophila sp. TaxID=1929485 RepID=UPI003077B2AB
MAEFASKGVAGTGLGLGIAGTALGLLNGGGGFGGLGGIFGGGAREGVALGVLAEKDAKIAELKAENYSDKIGKEVYGQSLADNLRLREDLAAFIKPLSDEAANNRVNIARIEEQIKCMGQTADLREQIVLGKVNEVAMTANNGLTALSGALACLQQTVAGITKTIIPASAVCPQPMPAQNAWVAPNNCGCSCNNG